MDYEKAYKESFEAAKGLHDAGNALTKKQMEIVFPQLAESEDEKIRKELISQVEKSRHHPVDKARWLAWLEKQKEPHYTKRNALFDKCVENCDPEIMKRVSDEIDTMLEKEPEPIDPSDGESLRNRVGKEFLQPHWKPTEEQMKALLKVVDKARELHYSSNSGYDGYNELRSLYEQIKKLM